MSKRLAIFGASGFIGSALCERLFFHGDYDFVAFIRSAGNAAGIARLPIPIQSVDLLDAQALREALKGFDVVVNCSRGDSAVMLYGLKNLLNAAKRNRIGKFVHISSISIYGLDLALPPVTDETSPPKPDSGYGETKLKQDGMVFDAHRSGVPSVVLCPSIIYGPFSDYLLGLCRGLLARQVRLVDDGQHPANLVHVYNLVEAILAAVRTEQGTGERYFVNDPPGQTWKTFYHDMQTMLGIDNGLASVGRSEALKLLTQKQTHDHRFSDNIKVLLSGEFRQALSMIPMFKHANDFAASVFNRLSPSVQMRFRQRLEKPMPLKKQAGHDFNPELLRAQVRRNYFSSEKLANNLKYRPVLQYDHGLATVKSWLHFATVI